jgi:HAD superfamily phosphoserine phosphatase-like hydrolase
MPKFIFDLDGTVTSEETLPKIAAHFDIQEKIAELTRQTIAGDIPFVESFINRVGILGKLPVSEINDLLEHTALYQGIYRFIQTHAADCAIATGNIENWVEKLIKKINCKSFCSKIDLENNHVKKLTFILKKEDVVKRYQEAGEKVIFIGDGNNDMEAMRLADIAVACGLTHYPAKSVLTVANYLVFEESTLCRLLNQLY